MTRRCKLLVLQPCRDLVTTLGVELWGAKSKPDAKTKFVRFIIFFIYWTSLPVWIYLPQKDDTFPISLRLHTTCDLRYLIQYSSTPVFLKTAPIAHRWLTIRNICHCLLISRFKEAQSLVPCHISYSIHDLIMSKAIAPLNPEIWCLGWVLGTRSVIKNTRVTGIHNTQRQGWCCIGV